MRVALFTEAYEPYINGVVTHVRALKTGLEQLGHDVLVVCANPNIRRYSLKDGVLNCPGVRFKKVYNYGLATPISPIRFRYIKEFRPDIIHIHTEFGVGYSGAATAKSLNIPLVYTMHTMYDDYLYYIAPKKLINAAKKTAHAYAKVLAEKADCLTGPSKKVEKFFRSCGVQKPVHVISNPVEVDLFTPNCIDQQTRQKKRKKLGVEPDELLLCFCGRLGREKSVDVLLNYWAEVIRPQDRCKLMIIGEGPSKPELEDQARRLGIMDQIIFAGKVEHKNLPPYYDCCDLYATASLSDTNSISMLEGMSSGLPVLHIRDDLNKGQVIDGVNGFIYDSPQKFKHFIDSFKAMSHDEIQQLREASRNSVKQFGAETLANNLLKVYHIAQKVHHIPTNSSM